MRLSVLLAAASVATAVPVAVPAWAQVAEGPARSFAPRDLFGLRAASDPQVRPDGGQVAYVRLTNDIMSDSTKPSIWLVDLATGAQSPLIADDNANMTPRWSPDGTRLAYVVAGAGGPPQLYVRWMASGRSAKVATLEQAPNQIAWSPDSKTLAFTMLVLDEGKPLGAPIARPEGAKWAEPLKVIDRLTYRADGAGYLKPGYRHIFTVSADGGQPRQITFGKYDEAGPIRFDRDGRSIVFSSNRAEDRERDPGESDIWRVSLADGTLSRLTDRKGPDAQPALSPDGTKIAYVGYDDRIRGYENSRLYVMDRDGKNRRVLTGGLDRSVGAPQWAADGRSIYVQYEDHGLGKVARVSLDGKLADVASGLAGAEELDRPYTGGDYDQARGVVAFTQGGPDQPPDLAVARGGKVSRLTRLNEDLFAGKTLAKVEAMPVVSAYDKKPIDAWIVTPPNFDPQKKYPLILEIHGGPFAAYGPYFSTDDQLYAAAGYVVVYANPRGSTSYGDAFANEIDRNYPSHDYDDLMSVVDTAVAKGFVDENRLYVTGGSGGGALTAWIVGKTHRFRAAAAQKPVINWTSEVLTVDGYNFMAKYWFGKMPWEDPQGYWARSPLSLVGNVTTPTLVVVGEQDFRTPPPESEQFYQALQLRGVPTALVRVPGASHGGLAARPSQAGAKANAILGWFERYR
ncbi:alpha/beta hydrolase family protein [Phenylobacterium soli]|uniref:S9 family peptidase n=1 Tax=Phenylobacterium soli TaxID=2170551 RepID=A0A328A962_9CAUL|nr:S9 family peptidase [Phenylobacterium soli]RAK51140.1 S9 family peptidase [Phenylobacterium soli]